MVRPANPVDFWRGLALVFIFVNHIPGIYYSRFTHFHYSLSDSADLFVFLAGWGMRMMVGTPERRQSTWYLVLRLGGRTITLYAAQIMITMIALATLAGFGDDAFGGLARNPGALAAANEGDGAGRHADGAGKIYALDAFMREPVGEFHYRSIGGMLF